MTLNLKIILGMTKGDSRKHGHREALEDVGLLSLKMTI